MRALCARARCHRAPSPAPSDALTDAAATAVVPAAPQSEINATVHINCLLCLFCLMFLLVVAGTILDHIQNFEVAIEWLSTSLAAAPIPNPGQ